MIHYTTGPSRFQLGLGKPPPKPAKTSVNHDVGPSTLQALVDAKKGTGDSPSTKKIQLRRSSCLLSLWLDDACCKIVRQPEAYQTAKQVYPSDIEALASPTFL